MAFDFSKLRGKIREIYETEEIFANLIGITRSTLSRKLNNKVQFTPLEIKKAVELLDINDKDISIYFFSTGVRKYEQNNTK